jgi:hypothetical protein
MCLAARRHGNTLLENPDYPRAMGTNTDWIRRVAADKEGISWT